MLVVEIIAIVCGSLSAGLVAVLFTLIRRSWPQMTAALEVRVDRPVNWQPAAHSPWSPLARAA